MGAIPVVLSPRRGRSRTRKELPYPLIGAGFATHVPEGVGMSSQDPLLAEVYICLATPVIFQMALAQVVSDLIVAYLMLASLQVSVLRGQARCCDGQATIITVSEQEHAPQALPGSARVPAEGVLRKSRRRWVKGGLMLVVMLVLTFTGALHETSGGSAGAL